MSENKVVIKINYDQSKIKTLGKQSDEIVIWHTGRIASAIIAIVILLGTLIYAMTNNNTQESQEPAPLKTIEQPPIAISDSQTATTRQSAVNLGTTERTPATIAPTQHNGPTAYILDKRIIRAALVSEIKDREPGEKLKLPISVSPGQTIEAIYFSEIKNMKGQAVYHVWLKDEVQVAKIKRTLKSTKEPFSSSQAITHSHIGQWSVKLINQKGKLLSESSFQVTPQQ